MAQHGRQGGLLQSVHAVLRDNVGFAPGDLLVHHPQPVGARLRRREAARLDHQPGLQRGVVVGGDGVGVRPQPLQRHGLLEGLVIGHTHAAAEVDIPQLTVQGIPHPLGQGPAVPIAAAQHVGVQILGLQVNVDALHRHRQGIQQRLQLRQILLVDAELAGTAHGAAHAEAGVHPHADGPALSLRLAQRADAGHLNQGVGDDLALVPGGFQRRVGLSGGGEEDVRLCHAAPPAQQHLRRGGGVSAQAETGQRPHHRREGIGLDGVQQVISGEGLAQRLHLPPHHIVFIEVTRRVLPRQRQDVVVHDDAPLLILLAAVQQDPACDKRTDRKAGQHISPEIEPLIPAVGGIPRNEPGHQSSRGGNGGQYPSQRQLPQQEAQQSAHDQRHKKQKRINADHRPIHNVSPF